MDQVPSRELISLLIMSLSQGDIAQAHKDARRIRRFYPQSGQALITEACRIAAKEVLS